MRKLATESVAGWTPVVRIAAMNCAEQSCDKYQVSWGQNIGIRDWETYENIGIDEGLGFMGWEEGGQGWCKGVGGGGG